MRPGSMRVAWDRIIPQTNLTQDAIEGFAIGNPELDHFWLDKSLTYSKIGMCAVHVAMKGEDPTYAPPTGNWTRSRTWRSARGNG